MIAPFSVKNDFSENLVGEILQPTKERNSIIIAIHGYISDRKHGITIITDMLAHEGHYCLRFDLSGCGDSEGVHAEKTLSDWMNDTLKIIEYVKSLGYKKIALVSSSLGATSALNVALRVPIDRLCLCAAGADFYNKRLKKYGKKYVDEWKEKGFLEFVNNKGEKYRSDYSFIDDAKKHSFFGKVKEVNIETLFIYGSEDDKINLESNKNLVDEMPNSSLIILEGGGHNLSINSNKDKFLEIVKYWFSEW